MSLRQPYLSSRLQGLGTNIFTAMTQLAQEHSAVNLGQGFPDFDGPEPAKEAAVRAIRAGHNQYAPMPGLPALRQAVAEHQRRFYGLEHDPDHEVTIYNGATEAICASLLALLESGDEVLAFEPFYDSYRACVAMAGAVCRSVPLALDTAGREFVFDPERLAAAVSPRTRLLLLNTPHNPTGKVFSRTELEQVAEVARRHDLLVLSDEVYEHLVFAGEHLPIASLPGMGERTVTISSTGKTFSLTGWKIGYTCAPPAITAALRTAHQFLTFTNGTPFQHAMAEALNAPDSYYQDFHQAYLERRDLLCEGLERAGFAVIEPQGTYFALADIRPLGEQDGAAFCQHLPAKVGVAAIPVSAFCERPETGDHLVRFAFCKTLPVLREGVERLRRLQQAS